MKEILANLQEQEMKLDLEYRRLNIQLSMATNAEKIDQALLLHHVNVAHKYVTNAIETIQLFCP